MYIIIDTQTGNQMGKPYDQAKYARKQRDRLDSKYGGVRYVVRFVEVQS